ncbi:MAG: RnfABCDGE type electron transport complex subunit B [Bacteroidota bacterium]|nr:RnfABCDGE type electron transport complex subunit B [Bacteroidota bacterium]
MNLTLLAISALGGLALVLAVILYAAANTFKVSEDPRLDEVTEKLPGVNCGGCGFASCRNFAEACLKQNRLDALFCPVGGNKTMSAVAAVLGIEAVQAEPAIAVLRCNGSCAVRPKVAVYDGASTCGIAALTSGNLTDCLWGCLGLGDCVNACPFNAIRMNSATSLPEIEEDACVSCGACVNACPNGLFEIRKKRSITGRIYVACMNKDKGAIAGKACFVACIGCGKCEKVCAYHAVILKDNLAYINDDTCTQCRKCVKSCPTHAIHE